VMECVNAFKAIAVIIAGNRLVIWIPVLYQGVRTLLVIQVHMVPLTIQA